MPARARGATPRRAYRRIRTAIRALRRPSTAVVRCRHLLRGNDGAMVFCANRLLSFHKSLLGFFILSPRYIKIITEILLEVKY